MSTSMSHRNGRRGFTLIEVLLGVLILGLGLLGLASVFPLVVKKQRGAQDVIFGISSAKSVESILRGHGDLNDRSGKKGWAQYQSHLKEMARSSTSRVVDWSDAISGVKGGGKSKLYGNSITVQGDPPEPGSIIMWGTNISVANEAVVLRTSDRLLPQGTSVTPLYVWDMVPVLAGRLPEREPEFMPLRVAIFVRRIDPGIRVPAGQTLRDVIATGQAAAIAWDRDFYPTSDGKLTGGGSYATFLTVSASRASRRFGIATAPYSVLQFDASPTSAAALAVRQVGQKLVDIGGNIYTVVALPEETGKDYVSSKSVVVEPPLSDVTVDAINVGGTSGVGAPEFLVSPVIPASVEVVTIRR